MRASAYISRLDKNGNLSWPFWQLALQFYLPGSYFELLKFHGREIFHTQFTVPLGNSRTVGKRLWSVLTTLLHALDT